ncbi:hypothetical protein PN456_04850 [Nodularia spumigena CS-586/05]|uniref:hypothetical protein n=1 Tax=Nodularia spumigena TaxID=70799 RepID=UPI00232E8CF4|nr:hypothetical protein [Nodularia spumigena]MDB9344540.1 hypothetical protein [Nodularia spumigena CS-588/06]MDB9368289.1 hypothetical protein [Nodularia spumigena CS-586/05]
MERRNVDNRASKLSSPAMIHAIDCLGSVCVKVFQSIGARGDRSYRTHSKFARYALQLPYLLSFMPL